MVIQCDFGSPVNKGDLEKGTYLDPQLWVGDKMVQISNCCLQPGRNKSEQGRLEPTTLSLWAWRLIH